MPRTSEDEYFITVEGADNFTELDDTPIAYTGEAGKVVTVNSTEDGLEFITPSGGGGSVVTGRYTPTAIEQGGRIENITFPRGGMFKRFDNITEVIINASFTIKSGTTMGLFYIEIPNVLDSFASNTDVIGSLYDSVHNASGDIGYDITIYGNTGVTINEKPVIQVTVDAIDTFASDKTAYVSFIANMYTGV